MVFHAAAREEIAPLLSFSTKGSNLDSDVSDLCELSLPLGMKTNGTSAN